MARWPERNVIEKGKLILCEGNADEAFLRAIIRKRNLGDVSIRNTSDPDQTKVGGISRFGDLFLAITTFRGFENVTDILVVCDSDDDPEGNFNSICEQISRANTKTMPPDIFGIPEGYLYPTQTAPSVKIMSIPWIDVRGNLECICCESAMERSEHSEAMMNFAAATGALHWDSANSVGKFKMRALLAASNRQDPSIGIGKLWSNNDDDQFVPLGHSSFDKVADELMAFLS
ncbi:DUF3226 domain-containing protein [Microbaculum marinum]|uniref:DUF3226 domain-containing protein n=1 Tax=Microbaculum marinum TaxID=1764581 RepID=A0AAW9RJA0_9HYPH